MLKHFHFIDANGKDQGINVRNRAKELNDLLSDVDKIRVERKRARSNKSKFGGIGSEPEGFGGSGKKFGGFGSESLEFGGYSGGVYGDGGGFGGSSYSGPGYGGNSNDDFEEYQVEGGNYDSYEDSAPVSSSHKNTESRVEPKKPEADLFSFDDSAPGPSTVAAPAAATNTGDDFDEFDDFQSATPVTSPTKPSSGAATNPPSSASANLADIFSSFSAPPTSVKPTPATPSYSLAQPTAVIGSATAPSSNTSAATAQTSAKKDDAFGSLWSSSKKSVKPDQKSTSLASLAQQNATVSMWGSSNNSTSGASNGKPANSNDLLSL